MINKFIGKYRLSNFLGHGAGIEVYRATHADAPGTRYRVKRVLRNGVASEDFFDAFVALAQQLLVIGQFQRFAQWLFVIAGIVLDAGAGGVWELLGLNEIFPADFQAIHAEDIGGLVEEPLDV